ncbi:MAG: acyl--CoA ligase [Actinomycetota bacterium]|nr:acyl--CoA ligase [Actinomycetota bacterium]
MNAAELLWSTLRREEGSRLALVGDGLELSYAEVRRRLSALAACLLTGDVRTGDRVAMLSRNAPQYAEAYWAAISIGAISVPLNFRLAIPELRKLLIHCTPSAYFCSAEYVSVLELADPRACNVPIIYWGERLIGTPANCIYFDDVASNATAEEPLPITLGERDPMAIVFTGGTTGTPKGSVRTHGNAIAMALLAPGHALLGKRGASMCVTPIFHVAGQTSLLGWLWGGTIVMSAGHFDAPTFLSTVEKYSVESVFIVPTMALALTKIPDTSAYDISSLKEWRSGSAALPLEVARRLAEMYPHVRLANGAGSTEGGTFGSVPWTVMRSRRPGCVGRPPPGQEVRILDADGSFLSDQSGETLGEIILRGAQVCVAYWDAPEQTELAFAGGWFHTGDLGWIDEDGYLYLADRKEEMIISGGENVYPLEVEGVILRVAGILDVAVVGLPDERWGERVAAVIVVDGGDEIVQQVLSVCQDELASYKRPRALLRVEAIPRTVAGKIEKHAVRELLASRISEAGQVVH